MSKIILRFSHLRDRGICTSWTHLLDLIENHDFPEGFRPTPRTRAWTEESVDGWVDSRPAAGDAKPPLRGWAKQRAEAGKRRHHQHEDQGNSRRVTADEPPMPRGRT